MDSDYTFDNWFESKSEAQAYVNKLKAEGYQVKVKPDLKDDIFPQGYTIFKKPKI